MAFNVIILKGIYADTENAYLYYEQISTELAERFYSEYLECLNKLTHHPHSYTAYDFDFRRISLQKFPYIILYKIIDDETVVVNTLIYAGRNPALITEQLSRR